MVLLKLPVWPGWQCQSVSRADIEVQLPKPQSGGVSVGSAREQSPRNIDVGYLTIYCIYSADFHVLGLANPVTVTSKPLQTL